jgi:hypothetical protein
MRNHLHAGARSRDSTSQNRPSKKHAVVMPCEIAHTLVFCERFHRFHFK